jgi:hypothetical protein
MSFFKLGNGGAASAKNAVQAVPVKATRSAGGSRAAKAVPVVSDELEFVRF